MGGGRAASTRRSREGPKLTGWLAVARARGRTPGSGAGPGSEPGPGPNPGARAARVAAVLIVALGVGNAALRYEAAAKTPAPVPPVGRGEVAAAMAGTERYCTGYDTTFHGVWEGGGRGAAVAASPVLFRIGLNPGGTGCYAQLNVRTPPGVAPYEFPRFRAGAGPGAEPGPGGDMWTLRYQDAAIEINVGSGRVIRREGAKAVRKGRLLPEPPPVGKPLPPPSAQRMERWYGTWRGRFPGAPLRVTLRFAESSAGEVMGRMSMVLMSQDFTGRFHGDMLVFRWKNRHVGLIMEPDGGHFVYNDYRGRVSRFRRVR